VFDVTVRIGKGAHRLVVAWAGEGWPADVERVVGADTKVDAVAARDVSVGAREALEEHNMGWVDEAGRANLSAPSGLLLVRDVQDRPRPQPSAGWSRSSIAVSEAILEGAEPTVDVIQTVTGLSRGATANALSMLEQKGFLHRAARRGPGSARHLGDADALLDEYANAVAAANAKDPPILFHRLWRDTLDALVDELAPALIGLGAGWSTTGSAAAALLAPYLSSVPVIELYVDANTLSNRAAFYDALKLREVDSGHRIHVRPLPNRVTALGPVVDGVRCAPLARVYADLAAQGGRRAEAAQHLREVRHVGTGS